MKEKFRSEHTKFGMTLFVVGLALIVVCEAITNFGLVMSKFHTLMNIVSPFIYGLVMAYLLCPIYNWTVRNTYRLLGSKINNKRVVLRTSRVIATVAAIVIFIGIVGGMVALIIPETVSSLINLVQIVPERLVDFANWVTEKLEGINHPEVSEAVDKLIINTRNSLMKWTEKDFLPTIGLYMTQISQGVLVTVKTLMNILIGVIVCVYFLNSKEVFKAQSRKIICATMSRDRAMETFEFANFCNRTFGGFINGKILDSIIIGIICFVAMSILNLPYTVLVSTIIGVTNFIPFFGPFIGAIPSAIIICVESPMQALYFLILVLVLQQFDGNILGPKILGESTGLASFWVMFAIILGGGVFGFIGMVLGVPVFAVIYFYVKRYIEKKLARENKSINTAEYQDFNQYNINRKDIL